MMRKTGMKKDRLVDVQSAMGGMDADLNKHVDYDEWRQQLKAYVIIIVSSVN